MSCCGSHEERVAIHFGLHEPSFDHRVRRKINNVDLDEAAANFSRATRHCDNLVAIHQTHGGPKRGRRDKETSLNRAIVVLTIASWQAAVQDLVEACVENSRPVPDSTTGRGIYGLLAGRVRDEIGRFSTPNAENTRRLFRAVGIDPRSAWTWSQPGGRGRGQLTLSPSDVDEKINAWLQIRHAIAHGDELPAKQVLQVVRLCSDHKPPTDPSLRLADAKDCLAFFRRLAKLTGRVLAAHLSVTPPAEWK